MAINLDDVSCLLHLPIREKLRYHERVGREEAAEMMVTYLGADPTKEENEVAKTIGAHARFNFFLEKLYKDHRQQVDMWVMFDVSLFVRESDASVLLNAEYLVIQTY